MSRRRCPAGAFGGAKLSWESTVISAVVQCDLPLQPFTLNAQLTFSIDLSWVSETSKKNMIAKLNNPTRFDGATADDICLAYVNSAGNFVCLDAEEKNYDDDQHSLHTHGHTDLWGINMDTVTYELSALTDTDQTGAIDDVTLAVIFAPSPSYMQALKVTMPPVVEQKPFPWVLVIVLLVIILLLACTALYFYHFKVRSGPPSTCHLC